MGVATATIYLRSSLFELGDPVVFGCEPFLFESVVEGGVFSLGHGCADVGSDSLSCFVGASADLTFFYTHICHRLGGTVLGAQDRGQKALLFKRPCFSFDWSAMGTKGFFATQEGGEMKAFSMLLLTGILFWSVEGLGAENISVIVDGVTYSCKEGGEAPEKEWRCVPRCTARNGSGTCYQYGEDFCGYNAECVPNCTARNGSGRCYQYGPDQCRGL